MCNGIDVSSEYDYKTSTPTASGAGLRVKSATKIERFTSKRLEAWVKYTNTNAHCVVLINEM